MSRPKTLLGIMRIISAAGGELDTRIRLQKEAFLLAVSGSSFFDATDFDYHHYGPYSRTVSDALRFAVAQNWLDERAHYFDDQTNARYSYHLTDAGRKFLEESPDFNEEEVRAVRFMTRKAWRSLELAATVRFLEVKEGFVDRHSALEEAMRLKPATITYKNEAKDVLSEMT